MPSYRSDTIVPTESADDYAARLIAREAELTERRELDRELPTARKEAIARYLERRR